MKAIESEKEYYTKVRLLEWMEEKKNPSKRHIEIRNTLVDNIQEYEEKHFALPEPTEEDIKQFNKEQLGK